MVEALFWVSTLELTSVFVALITFGSNPLKNNLTNTLCVHLALYNTQSTSWKSVKVATEDYSCYYLFEFFLERSNSDFFFSVVSAQTVYMMLKFAKIWPQLIDFVVVIFRVNSLQSVPSFGISAFFGIILANIDEIHVKDKSTTTGYGL